ncbi:serine protease snk-like [Arctopsyche grandis]|uniref:serine protease snk-like n=1 Tax=Arctopsyche grandis TaxID=121162 RepID=UPI00406D7515
MIRIALIALTLEAAYCQYAGDSCILNHNSSPGVCKLNSQCESVFKVLKCKNIKPTLCSFQGNTPVVCCPLDNEDLRGCNIEASSTNSKPSVQKCREYKKCNGVSRSTRSNEGGPEIAGGIETTPWEYPHMAAIGWKLIDEDDYLWSCGGSLVSERYAVTAAHCTYLSDTRVINPAPTIVRLGEHNLRIRNKYTQDITIASITKHPQYKGSKKYHDIALLRLEKPAALSAHVSPICLWQTLDIPVKSVVASGWGKLGFVEDSSDTLQKVSIDLIDKKTCVDFYKDRSRKLPDGIIDGQLCAADLGGGKDTCQGDSGGPIQIRDPEVSCAYQLIGITSFGVACGGKNSPAVYTRISYYVDWIESIVWP